MHLGVQGREGLIAGRGWINAAVDLCSRRAAWHPAFFVWSTKAIEAWAAAVLAVPGAQLCFHTSALPWGPLCYSELEMTFGSVRAPVPSARVCHASAPSLHINTLPLTHHLLRDVLGNALSESFFPMKTSLWLNLSGQL